MVSLPWRKKKLNTSKKQRDGKNSKGIYPSYDEECSGKQQTDFVEIDIDGVKIRVRRKLNLNVPHEVSAFIPRAEIRRRTYQAGQLAFEEEMILNSITIVHAPRHPLAGEESTGSASKDKYDYSKNPSVPRINFCYTSRR